jgi:hypothetical protein
MQSCPERNALGSFSRYGGADDSAKAKQRMMRRKFI